MLKHVSLITTAIMMSGLMASADIIDTIQAAKSGQTVNVSGTYSVSRQCNVPSGVTVTGPATFNFNGAGNGFVPGNNVRLNQITVTKVNHPGIYIYGKSGCVINSCNAYGNYDSGIQIQGSGANNNTIQYCQSYNNADSSGGNADGYACKFSAGSGNKFVTCYAHNNSDDGFDLWQTGAAVSFSGCQAYSNGSYNGKTGNGNGFKMGSSGMNLAHSLSSCIAHNNAGDTGCGFTQNGNTGNCHLTSCHSYSNKHADVLNNCTLSNCTMQN